MSHEIYIKRCLQIAKNGIGSARPNPSVGAVVVYNNKIIGEGFTSIYGGNHAEVNAINSVKDTSLLKEATIYVTLEPCSHFGKTPPCADLIVKHQLKTVVIGCVDSNSLVAGKGIERLENSGINVIVGVLEEECREHHKRFFTVQDKKRPYIILKWAETKDGFIAPLTKDEQKPVWISNQYSQQLVHKWRSEEHAILVGTNTVIADNPKLNVRSWSGQNPVRIVLDKSLRTNKDLAVFDGSVRTIFITEKVDESQESKGNLIFETIDFSKNIGIQICEVLQKHQIQSVIIEGGLQTLQTFINENLWDEARVFVGETEFKEGVKAPNFNKGFKEKINITTDVLKIYTND
ncbi:bifunctional diaminohydroxyphosphoribosylaminopyrimidine deaminase/5-amino-6-(5-phosphoribosylamino)uracil reductase RibD [Polaribacter sp. SA4-12]|uniref:bifunctional diaminohydroxyphosphoribosylaminopyrimidine deaminase/5-amino-6-(5-phosphoribosylamino)uracil reductase RibD n=1 Tax=Polaribacter sp. SA4-12 TaxID=1312072 RepID=UPI000B5529B4|nr:bifunctional diaminohydroxyphosphoribosylaminopyrimidine deaminase/5-amino-6-(5-phosphoribosylamino)uracil reductase RibD [Polaribacter sp. SA4-12]ARV16761.1 riboflavin biosynthesis protein RibD [Polaribacter sp. SA4-12]